MASALGCGSHTELGTSIVLWLPSFWYLARVNRSWKGVVLGAVSILRKMLWRSSFSVDWLIEAWGGPLFQAPDARLHRLLTIHGWRSWANEMEDLSRFWYNLQLHLHRYCQKANASYKDIFDICFRQCAVSEYSRRELFPCVFQACEVSLDQRIDVTLFSDLGFVGARDLGCFNLGCSVEEVLGTLRCMLDHDEYCPRMCGCQELDPDDSAVDPDDETPSDEASTVADAT